MALLGVFAQGFAGPSAAIAGKEGTRMAAITVFMGSPNDLAHERRQFRETIEQLNKGFGDGYGVQFQALGWEDAPATTGRRVQDVINEYIDICDVFILVLKRRW